MPKLWDRASGGDRRRFRHHGGDIDKGRGTRVARQHVADRRHPRGVITILGPISGAHFNPAVSLVFALKRELAARDTLFYVVAQIAGGIAGTLIAHLMFGLPLIEASLKARTGGAQWFAEAVAAFGLIATILGEFALPITRCLGWWAFT